MDHSDLWNSFSYFLSELNRIETIAGTLATVEREHYRKLTGFDHRELTDIAVEEQNTARQLGAIKQICNSMAQKIQELQDTYKAGSGGSAGRNEVH